MIYVRYKKLTDTAIKPSKGSTFAAGYDLYADTDVDVWVEPGETVNFYTGIAFEIPDGYFGAVYSRSGLGIKHNMRMPNCVGIIDADYRGNVMVPLFNDGKEPFKVLAHERVAQIVFQECPGVELYKTEELSKTERGTNGFGSSGRT